ncbi:hypothetical protein [Saccharothrix sp. ST-888]|uniref:hypothetical protein n=1 Tax=Saccharothrix sp. ST-888 TaxID=1427391 RepID=UPI0005EC71AD|nr:hypothetical protein [Saccharothrix sp. ST-888]KJK57374.1 hypothetical protein UK12_16695 [Saccharothrix sp. ST-888]
MNEELERLARLAVEYRDIGCSVVEVADLMVEKHPGLREVPFNLAQILRSAFRLSVHDLQYINAWLQGDISRETLEERLQVIG